MHVSELRLANFRNIPSASLAFSKNVNAFCGDNGQGKTNTLEAILLALTGRSHRERRPWAFVGPAGAQSSVEAAAKADDGQEYFVSLAITAEKKTYLLDGSPVKRRSEISRLFPVILFEPSDLSLIKGPPAVRRAYLDESIASFSKEYSAALAEYERVLAQKSSILRAYSRSLDSMLDIYDEKLASCGSRIVKYRIKFLKELKPHVEKLYRFMSGEREEMGLSYINGALSQLEERSIEKSFVRLLERSRKEDIRTMSCVEGVHRDEAVITLNGRPAQSFASQGQQKSLALCLKLALIPVYRSLTGERPAILLDDVLSELDEDRRTMALSCLAGTQAFITATEENFLESRRDALVFRVNGGSYSNGR
jgi:DNA replication and repair protein RecF